MAEITIKEILDDIGVADEVLRKFEEKYGIISQLFYDLYSQGALDDGEQTEDFSEWAGFYKLKLRREEKFRQLSQELIESLRVSPSTEGLRLVPQRSLTED